MLYPHWGGLHCPVNVATGGLDASGEEVSADAVRIGESGGSGGGLLGWRMGRKKDGRKRGVELVSTICSPPGLRLLYPISSRAQEPKEQVYLFP